MSDDPSTGAVDPQSQTPSPNPSPASTPSGPESTRQGALGAPGWGQSALEAENWGGTWVRPHDHDKEQFGIGGAYGGGGSGQGGSADGSRRSGPKPIRGPRFSGGPLIAGFGLLSMLIVIGIMVFLVVKVLDGVEGSTPQEPITTHADELSPDEATDRTSGDVVFNFQPSVAAKKKCRIDRETIETASEAYGIVNGHPPASMDDLAEEFLKEANPNFTVRAHGDTVVIKGTGVCEGI